MLAEIDNYRVTDYKSATTVAGGFAKAGIKYYFGTSEIISKWSIRMQNKSFYNFMNNAKSESNENKSESNEKTTSYQNPRYLD